MGDYSTFLFAMPSRLRGVASVVDLGAVFGGFNKSSTSAAADQRALRADAMAAFADARQALDELAGQAS